jgi:hypothetical protein
MRRSHALAILPFLFQLTTGVATAAERECMQYVPSVDKLVAVECEELRAAPAEPAAPAAAPPVAPAPVVAGRALEGADKLKKDVVELTDALTSAAGDTAFREAFCTLHATRQLLLQQKVRTEIARLQDQHVALQAKVGARGSLVRTALTEPVMGMLLGTPVDDALPATLLRQTPEGQAFLKARDGMRLSCNCLHETEPPKRLMCCDSCDDKALQARL